MVHATLTSTLSPGRFVGRRSSNPFAYHGCFPVHGPLLLLCTKPAQEGKRPESMETEKTSARRPRPKSLKGLDWVSDGSGISFG